MGEYMSNFIDKNYVYKSEGEEDNEDKSLDSTHKTLTVQGSSTSKHTSPTVVQDQT